MSAALLSLPALNALRAQLTEDLNTDDPLIVLTGESGSGRSLMLETIAGDLYQQHPIYLPCGRGLTLKALRQAFLKQLQPGAEVSLELNLAAAVNCLTLKEQRRVLVLIDDADKAPPALLKEFYALHEQEQGRRRFAFILTGSPKWAAAQLKTLKPLGALYRELSPLSPEESLELCRRILTNNHLVQVYNKLEPALPAELAAVGGNLAAVIKFTEKIMSQQQNLNLSSKAPEASAAPHPDKKRSRGPLVLIILALLVIAGLIYAFKTGEPKPSADEQGAESTESARPVLSGIASEPVIDDGVLNEPLSEGLEADTPPADMQQSITLSGEDLDRIEAGAPATAPAAADNQKGAVSAPAAPVKLNRTDNLLRVKPAPAPAEGAVSAPEDAGAPSSEPAVLDSPAPAAAPAAGTPSAAPAAAGSSPSIVPPTAAAGRSQVSRSGVLYPENVPFSGQAVPGGSCELTYKNDAHYTVQVVAGRSRAAVVEVSAALAGRYWVYQTVYEGAPWYVLIVGEYPNRAGAADAARLLPSAVQAAQPFIKSFSAVKSEMALAQQGCV